MSSVPDQPTVGSHQARRSRRRRRAEPDRASRTRKLHIGVLLFAVLWAYVTALSGDFVWTDSRDLLQGGQRLLSVEDIGHALQLSNRQYIDRLEGGIHSDSSGSWRPVTILNYTLSWTLFGKCGVCHHLENLLWHALVVVGLYVLGRHLLRLRRHGATVAFWATLAFAVHPLGVSSVAWIGGRPVLLVSTLSIWTLVLLTRLPATSKSHRQHVNRWQLGIALGVVLALGTEERAMLLPFAALLVAWFESRERGRTGITGISRQRRLALLSIASMVLLIIFYRAASLGFPNFAGDYPGTRLLDSLGTALRLFWWKVLQVLVPGEPVLSDAFPVTFGWDVAEFAALIATLGLIAATGYGLIHRHPLGLGVAWFLLWGLPGSGLLPVQHYYDEASLYPAYWGLMFGLTYVLFRLWRPLGRQLARGSEAIVFGPIAIVLLALTASSNVRWQTNSTLFESEVDNDPHYRQGRVVLAQVALDQRDWEGALNHGLITEQSREDKRFTGFIPEYQHQMQLGRAQLALQLADDARLSYAEATAINSVSVRALQGLAAANLALGEFAQVEANIEAALAIRPHDAGVNLTLGRLRLDQRRYQEAQTVFLQAMARGRRGLAFRLGLAKAQIGLGHYPQAETELRRALAETSSPAARAQLAWTLWKLGRSDEARVELDRITVELRRLLPAEQLTDLLAALGSPTPAAEPGTMPETADGVAPIPNGDTLD